MLTEDISRVQIQIDHRQFSLCTGQYFVFIIMVSFCLSVSFLLIIYHTVMIKDD